MADEVHGLKHFTDHFAQLSDQYVIIGGIATNYFLLANDLITRRTKDIDLVVLANPNQVFADRLRDYASLGRYQIETDSSGKKRNYRFRNPEVAEYPKQIEIFSAAPLELILGTDQRIVPFLTSPGLESLSAILMDGDYFVLVKATSFVQEGIPLLSSDGIIPLKVRAFLDLDSRKRQGERIDQSDIKKHRNDIMRLSQTLKIETFKVADSIKGDLRSFLNHPDIVALETTAIESIVEPGFTIEQAKRTLAEHFEL
jgi:hypothetical protein